MVADEGSIAVAVNVDGPLEAVEVCMACAYIFGLQVFKLAVDIEAVLQGGHGALHRLWKPRSLLRCTLEGLTTLVLPGRLQTPPSARLEACCRLAFQAEAQGETRDCTGRSYADSVCGSAPDVDFQT